jgi:hypothetical protein
VSRDGIVRPQLHLTAEVAESISGDADADTRAVSRLDVDDGIADEERVCRLNRRLLHQVKQRRRIRLAREP